MSKDTNSLAHMTWNCKAVHDAVGCWINKLPISREELLEAIDRKGLKQWA